MKRILIIEDDRIKIGKLESFLSPNSYTIKESFQSGVSELRFNSEEYDLLILDMTIPLWEKGFNDLGGNYEQFGGEKILREMKRRKIYLPTILFTMFDIFPSKDGNITFFELDDMFKNNFKNFYVGAVFYNANEEDWKDNLNKLIIKSGLKYE